MHYITVTWIYWYSTGVTCYVLYEYNVYLPALFQLTEVFAFVDSLGALKIELFGEGVQDTFKLQGIRYVLTSLL